MSLTNRGRAFNASVEVASTLHPAAAAAPFSKRGYRIGINMRTRQVVYKDPWWMRLDQDGQRHTSVTKSTVWESIGDTRTGKSTFGKDEVCLLLGRAGQLNPNGEPEYLRVELNSNKAEAGRSEIEPLINYFGGKMLYLRQHPGINLFDPYFGTGSTELLETALELAETAKGAPLEGFEPLMYQIGIFIMLHGGHSDISTQLLQQIILGLKQAEDFSAFNRSISDDVLRSHAQLAERRPDLAKRLNYDLYPATIPSDEFDRAKSLAAGYLGRIHSGEYGSLFGSTISYSELCTGRLVGKEWHGVPDKARAVLQAMESKAMRIARGPGGDISRIPHARISDEAAKAMEIPMVVRMRADYVRTASVTATYELQAAQYISQVTKVGAADSDLRARASEIQFGVGARNIFRIAEDDYELIERLENARISREDIRRCTRLPQGCFAVWIPGRKLTFVRHVPTRIQSQLIDTESSLRSMTTDREQPAHFEDLARGYERTYGSQLLGAESPHNGHSHGKEFGHVR